jgi:hypothetical protein
MISSEEAFAILGKWKARRSSLWFFVDLPLASAGKESPTVWIRDISGMPFHISFLVLSGPDKGETLEVDLKDAVFEHGEEPKPGMPPEAGSFLETTLASGGRLLLVERRE